MEFMIQNVDIKKRNTGLEYKMRQWSLSLLSY